MDALARFWLQEFADELSTVSSIEHYPPIVSFGTSDLDSDNQSDDLPHEVKEFEGTEDVDDLSTVTVPPSLDPILTQATATSSEERRQAEEEHHKRRQLYLKAREEGKLIAAKTVWPYQEPFPLTWETIHRRRLYELYVGPVDEIHKLYVGPVDDQVGDRRTGTAHSNYQL